jgi:hypothetical protein
MSRSQEQGQCAPHRKDRQETMEKRIEKLESVKSEKLDELSIEDVLGERASELPEKTLMRHKKHFKSYSSYYPCYYYDYCYYDSCYYY